MQAKRKLNHSPFIFGLTILFFVAACPFASAHTSPNDIVSHRSDANLNTAAIYTMNAGGSNQVRLTNNTVPDEAPKWKRSQTVVALRSVLYDFDGDGKADQTVFRPSNAVWYSLGSSAGFTAAQFGVSTDKITPADFDGDGKTDIAVFCDNGENPDSAYFFILNSRDDTVRIEQLGRRGDVPAVGDWNGDGKADVALYRDAADGFQNMFFYRSSGNNPNGVITVLPWGTAGDKPLAADYDGDGKMDAAVFRALNYTWFIRNSSDASVHYDYWGLASDTFIPADYDGDGKADLAVFRNGIWYIKQSANNEPRVENWGLPTDKLVPADYDGDGKTDIAVYRDGVWYIRQSTGAIRYAYFGLSGDVPIASVSAR